MVLRQRRRPVGLAQQYSFEGIDSIEQRIRRLAEHAVYVAVWDRTDRKTEEPAGRFEFNLAAALPYLVDEPDPEEEEEEEESDQLLLDDPEDGDEDDGDEPSLVDVFSPSRGTSRDVGPARIAEAACRWLRDLAMRHTAAEAYRRFRVRICGPKGIQTLDGGSFLCRNHGYQEELEDEQEKVARLEIPPPSFEQAAHEGGAKAMKSLGDLYAQWGQIVIGSVGQLQGVNNAMNGQLHRQLHEARTQVDQLVAAILEYRHKQAVAEDDRDKEERDGDTRAALARDAIRQVGDAARTFLLSRGLTPETAELLGVLGESPELSAALQDPDVRRLMQEPDNLKALAALLRQAAAQAKAAGAPGPQAAHPAEEPPEAGPQPEHHPQPAG